MQNLINVKNSLSELRMDFIGIHFNIFDFIPLIIAILFTILFFFYCFHVGQKIRKWIFPKTETWKEKFFITIALGYIFVCSGIALLGIFSLLTSLFLSGYLLITTLLIFFPFSSFLSSCRELYKNISLKNIDWRRNTWIKASVLIFITITFLRLIPPETGADALSYHVTYPRLYLHYQTMMLEPKGTESYMTIPQLGEMPYVLSVFFATLDSTRFIHFAFYLLTVLLLLTGINRLTKSNLGFYAAIIFMTAPLMLHMASSGQSDLQALFCFLLAVIILTKEKKLSSMHLSLAALFFGGALATKLWMLVFLPGLLLFIAMKNNVLQTKHWLSITKQIGIFLGISLLVVSMWYIRSYLLSGSMLYHSEIVSPNIEPSDLSEKMQTVFNWSEKLNPNFIADYSPLFFIGILGLFLSPVFLYRQFRKPQIISLSTILLATSLFLPSLIVTPRYLLPLYTLLTIIAACGLVQITKHRVGKFILVGFVIFLILYFSMNSLSFLPYGLGWADKEALIKRILLRENSYYDYTGEFSANTTPNEVVATYGASTFYYAHFIHRHVYHIFSKKNNSLQKLKDQDIHKLLLMGGDIAWFCKELDVRDCQKGSVELLASYLPAKLYLYAIR